MVGRHRGVRGKREETFITFPPFFSLFVQKKHVQSNKKAFFGQSRAAAASNSNAMGLNTHTNNNANNYHGSYQTKKDFILCANLY